MAYFWNRKEIMAKFKANTKMVDIWRKKRPRLELKPTQNGHCFNYVMLNEVCVMKNTQF